MKTQEKRTSAFQDVLAGFKRLFWDDLQYFYKKEFYSELYILHFMVTVFILEHIMPVIIQYFDLKDTPLYFQCFISGLIGWTMNWLRELYKERKAKKENWVYPFDYTDVNFGFYAGVYVPIYLYLLNLLNH